MPKQNPYKNSAIKNDKNLQALSDKEWEELNKEIRELEKQANNSEKVTTKYNYSYMPMIEVINNIDEYIIPELQEACKLLWEKNIYTHMCSNRNDGGSTYIVLESLSPENTEIFKQLQMQNQNILQLIHGDTIVFV